MTRVLQMLFSNIVIAFIIISTADATVIENSSTKRIETTTDKYKECDCGPNAISCDFVYGTKQCSCKEGYSGYKDIYEREETCKKCDCGPNSVSCKFEWGNRRCRCKNGYGRAYGNIEETCSECDCGDGECEIQSDVKKCHCHGKLIAVNGKCQKCDCGPNTISCELDYMDRRKCTCKDGYAPFKLFSIGDESCKECDCGTYGTSCSFDTSGFKQLPTCKCSYGGYDRTKEGKCKECDCGPHSDSCHFNSDGKRRCSCNRGYIAEKEYSWEDEYCNYITIDRSGNVSGWRIGTYVIAAVFGVIIVGILITIAYKYKNGSL